MPVRSKVVASTAGAGAGAALGSFVLWLLGVLVFHAPADAGSADVALASVPAPVSAIVLVALTAAVSFIAGYFKVDSEH